MSAAASVVIRPLETVPEFDACVSMQRDIWGFSDTDLVPRRMFVVAHSTGGQVLGAFANSAAAPLIGYCLACAGIRDRRPYWHSHMLAVAPAHRNSGLGRRLKLRQRDLAMEQGIDLIEWTFDPLEIKNAWFNLVRLGAIARRYYPNHYGMSTSRLQAGLPTDRLVAEWWLRSPRVEAVTAGTPLPVPAPAGLVEVPASVDAWRAAADPRAVELQTRNREALQQAFQRGLAAIGYERRPAAEAPGKSDGAFLLGRWEGAH